MRHASSDLQAWSETSRIHSAVVAPGRKPGGRDRAPPHVTDPDQPAPPQGLDAPKPRPERLHPANPPGTRCGRFTLAASLAAGLVALAVPAASHAATVGPASIGGVDYVRYTADLGEANRLDIRAAAGSTIAFVDPGATITPSAPCVSVSDHEARCAAASTPALAVALGNGDDTLDVEVAKPGIYAGDDGGDTLSGGAGTEALRGGAGNDVLEGGTGADLLVGGSGVDTVTYASRTAGVTVDLASLSLGTEGQVGEHDTVAPDVERVVGGAGDDTLTGNAAANQLDGGAGDDTLDGGAGDDTLNGAAGNDTLTGGTGVDSLHGAEGDDTLRGRDGAADDLNCGADDDAVDADATDSLTSCETTAAPAPAPTPAPPAGPLTIPFSFIFGHVKVPDHPVTLFHGHVTLTVSCPADAPGGLCKGVLSLEMPRHAKHSTTAQTSRRTRRFRRLGDQAYAIRAGSRKTLRVRIASVGRRAVKRSGSVKVKVLLRRTKRSKSATKVGTLKVHASRRTKRRHLRADA